MPELFIKIFSILRRLKEKVLLKISNKLYILLEKFSPNFFLRLHSKTLTQACSQPSRIQSSPLETGLFKFCTWNHQSAPVLRAHLQFCAAMSPITISCDFKKVSLDEALSLSLWTGWMRRWTYLCQLFLKSQFKSIPFLFVMESLKLTGNKILWMRRLSFSWEYLSEYLVTLIVVLLLLQIHGDDGRFSLKSP